MSLGMVEPRKGGFMGNTGAIWVSLVVFVLSAGGFAGSVHGAQPAPGGRVPTTDSSLIETALPRKQVLDCRPSGNGYACDVEMTVPNMSTTLINAWGGKSYTLFIQGTAFQLTLRSSDDMANEIVASCERYAARAKAEGTMLKLKANWWSKPSFADPKEQNSLKLDFNGNPDSPTSVECYE
jgi:hypothetical protein